jgi:tryptophan 7-halogenase
VGPMDNADTESTASRLLRENAAMTKQLRAQLPKNRELIRKIHEHGLQRI